MPSGGFVDSKQYVRIIVKNNIRPLGSFLVFYK